MKKYIIILTILCSCGYLSDEEYRTTSVICDSLYLEIYTNAGGVIANDDRLYILTDSINYRLNVASIHNDSYRFKYICLDDKILFVQYDNFRNSIQENFTIIKNNFERIDGTKPNEYYSKHTLFNRPNNFNKIDTVSNNFIIHMNLNKDESKSIYVNGLYTDKMSFVFDCDNSEEYIYKCINDRILFVRYRGNLILESRVFLFR
jgi:hypothetical protein